MIPHHPTGVSPRQRKVATGFFSLAESEGFFLCGGAGLIANGNIDGRTEDLDLFTRPGVGIHVAAAALAEWCRREGLEVTVIRKYDQFVQMKVESPDGNTTLVDMAEDAVPKVLTMTPLGPVPSTVDAAVRKLLALFGRMEPRDFADVYELSWRVAKSDMVAGAVELDRGFDQEMLAESMTMIRRIRNDRIPHPDPAAV